MVRRVKGGHGIAGIAQRRSEHHVTVRLGKVGRRSQENHGQATEARHVEAGEFRRIWEWISGTGAAMSGLAGMVIAGLGSDRPVMDWQARRIWAVLAIRCWASSGKAGVAIQVTGR